MRIKALDICAPGIANRSAARALFKGQAEWQHAPMALAAAEILPAGMRRRLSRLIQLALQVAASVQHETSVNVAELPIVFASSCGDLDITDRICKALCQPDKPVSPTLFHNSVHNAPAGYWSIGTQSQVMSTSIAAGDYSFAAGLLEAACLAHSEQQPVMLVCYDLAVDNALAAQVDLGDSFASAWLLAPEEFAADSGMPLVELAAQQAGHETRLAHEALEALRCSNPAARSLALLHELTCPTGEGIMLPSMPEQCLRVQLQK